MDEANNILGQIQTIAVIACAASGVVAGLRIFSKWNRGEEVTHLILSWIAGLASVGVLVYAIRTYIVGGPLATGAGLPLGWAGQLNYDIYEFALLAGIVISIVSFIRIYTKYTGGEDVVPLIYQWVGSLLFLGAMGYIIEALVRY